MDFEDWKERLKKASEESIIIVEGKKDKEKLNKYSIKNIFVIQGQKFYDIIDYIAENYKKCIILTDLDKHGEKIYQKLSSALSKEGVEIDNSFRENLKETNVEEIENLP